MLEIDSRVSLSDSWLLLLQRLIKNSGMGDLVAYLKVHFTEEQAPLALLMREGNQTAMHGFLIKVSYLEQRRHGHHKLLVQGLGRFQASRVFKEEEEAAQ